MKKISFKCTIEDGFNDTLIEGARFEGYFDIPCIKGIAPEDLPFADQCIPISQRKRIPKEHRSHTAICFYEHDINFQEIELKIDSLLEELLDYAFVITPDNSLYVDDPLTVQIINLYRSRAFGYYLQKNGIKVVTNVRWGDKRTYFPLNNIEKKAIAFCGAPFNSVIAVGTYGCIKGKENTLTFKEGFYAAIDVLNPKLIIVYGPMPNEIFTDVPQNIKILNFQDWTTYKHKESRKKVA